MPFINLLDSKFLKGSPVDINYESALLNNTEFLNSELAQAKTNFSLFSENIIPATTETYSIGSITKAMLDIYSKQIRSSTLILNTNAGGKNTNIVYDPSVLIKFLVEDVLTASISKNELELYGNLKLTSEADTTFWSLASTLGELSFGFYSTVLEKKLSITSSQTKVLNSFIVEADSQSIITVNADDGVRVDKTISIVPLEVTTGGEISVAGISKILVDTSSSNITITGFSEATEGQLLYIIKKVAANTLTIKHNGSATTINSVFLKGLADYSLGANNFGGLILSFDDDVWREVSRS